MTESEQLDFAMSNILMALGIIADWSDWSDWYACGDDLI